MQADLATLNWACCPPQRVYLLEGAPLPTRVDALGSAAG
jgi:hypothetical protein